MLHIYVLPFCVNASSTTHGRPAMERVVPIAHANAKINGSKNEQQQKKKNVG